ncbi:MAG: amidase [Desulfobacterales bacterium]
MGGIFDYEQYDGLGLAELVRKKEVKPGEILEEAIRRIEKLNPNLNAIIHKLYDTAAATAGNDLPAGPFTGVPFLLKDVHHALQGVPMCCGSNSMKDYVPSYDAEIVRRFKRAGVLIIGKTNTPEFKLSAFTEPAAFGPTRNPWNPEYSCGGSSGGSAAAVAARIVPLASGTDEGGSIRIPSSYCGVFGLKPSRGRNPVGPDFIEEFGGISTSHVITRSVRDSAAMLDATTGPETGTPYSIERNERPFLEELLEDPGRLRIALHQPSAFGEKIHHECLQAVEHAAGLLESLGHRVEKADPGYHEEEVALTWCKNIIGHLAVYLDAMIEKGTIQRVGNNIEIQNRTMIQLGKRMRAVDFIPVKIKMREFGMQMGRFMQQYDLILTPVLGRPPVKVGSQQPGKADQFSMKLILSWVGKMLSLSDGITGFLVKELVRNAITGQLPFTMIANMTGQPAMSVPLHWTSDGLPCGVQFIGRYGDEATLFRLAAQLEQAEPWLHKNPGGIV